MYYNNSNHIVHSNLQCNSFTVIVYNNVQESDIYIYMNIYMYIYYICVWPFGCGAQSDTTSAINRLSAPCLNYTKTRKITMQMNGNQLHDICKPVSEVQSMFCSTQTILDYFTSVIKHYYKQIFNIVFQNIVSNQYCTIIIIFIIIIRYMYTRDGAFFILFRLAHHNLLPHVCDSLTIKCKAEDDWH